MSRTLAIAALMSLLVLIDINDALAEAKPATTNGRVVEVTLFRGQAQVTRIIDLKSTDGSGEIVIGNLPEQTLPSSLFAEGGEGLEIRAVQFRQRAIGEEPREEVRELDKQILDTQQKIQLTTKKRSLLAKRSEYLDKLEAFVAPTAQSDLTKGVLDAAALERVTTFAFKQREQIAQDEVALDNQLHQLAEERQLLDRKRAEITAGAAKTIREAVLFFQKNGEGPATVRLNYLVNNCGWSPSYTMRSAAERDKVRVEYNALIHQLSGEDWKDVTLTLSTASPALSAAGPGLAPFHVTLASGAQQIANSQSQNQQSEVGVFGNYAPGQSKAQVSDKLRSLNVKRDEIAQAANAAVAFDVQNQLTWNLNTFACAVQQIELSGDETALSVLRSEDLTDGDGPSLSYQLPASVSLTSRSDKQMVRIMHSDMPSKFYHVAAPVLNSFVYREAELKNTGSEDLLAGPMTVYLHGRFVGQGEIPTVARGQSFVVGFGADPQLRARRELVDKQDNVQGGNRETRFEYRLTIENFGPEPTPMRVLDRIPYADHDTDIRVSIGKTSDPLSEDKLYVRQERPMGILRWDIKAPAGAASEDARLIEYSYTVEYDRKFVVSLPESAQKLQEEFERLQRDRQKRGG